jgi:hypothetical protein
MVRSGPRRDHAHMTNALRRLRNAVTSIASDSRPDFKRVDASPALYDDGSWLTPKPT